MIAILASLFSIGMIISQLSIIGDLKCAFKTRTNVPILQFLVSFASSVLWLKYGLIRDDQTIAGVNGFGSVISFYILANFWRYSHNRTSIEKQVLASSVLTLLAIIYVDRTGTTQATEVFSLLCCLSTLLFLGSPLSQVGNVIRQKDASVLLPLITGLAFGNNVLWAVYGYLHNDMFMLAPNALGAAMCAFQLLLVVYFGRSKVKLPVAVKHSGYSDDDGDGNVQMAEITR